MSQIICIVSIKYRDDNVKNYDCGDTPAVNADWITHYPSKDPTSHKMIPREGVAEINWKYQIK